VKVPPGNISQSYIQVFPVKSGANMPKVMIDVDELRKMIREEIHNAFEEYEFLTKEDLRDKAEAMEELANGNSITWDTYLTTRNIK
jgi:hypothetical protein